MFLLDKVIIFRKLCFPPLKAAEGPLPEDPYLPEGIESLQWAEAAIEKKGPYRFPERIVWQGKGMPVEPDFG